jgi:hypothetical protein
MNTRTVTEQELLALEDAALDRWGKGDPSGFLELSAEDVTYFDPFLPIRIDGLERLTRYYEGLRGKIAAVGHQIVHPSFHHLGEGVVLTYNLISQGADGSTSRWACTEVFRRQGEAWRIVQTHWSFAGPPV